MSAREDENDGDLIGKIATGDKRALARLYDRHASLLVAVARRILGDLREAEDLVHDVFLEVWRQAADFDAARGSARTWMMVRLRSRALDRKKAPRVARAVALDEQRMGEIAQPAAAEDPTLAADRGRVRAALAALPEEQRVVLELGYYEGLSSSEIATRIDCPIGTVKSRVAAAIAKLRARLAGETGSKS